MQTDFSFSIAFSVLTYMKYGITHRVTLLFLSSELIHDIATGKF